LHLREQPRGEQFEGHRGRQRITGNLDGGNGSERVTGLQAAGAGKRGPAGLCVAEQHWVARPDGDAVDGQAADLSEDGGEVAPSAAGAGDDEHEVGAACGFPDGGREDVR